MTARLSGRSTAVMSHDAQQPTVDYLAARLQQLDGTWKVTHEEGFSP